MNSEVALNAVLARAVRFSAVPEKVILCLSPCRSGSTALLRAFTAVGFPAYLQPIKAGIRCMLSNAEVAISINHTGEIFIKETLGPYYDAEASFDPVEILSQSGLAEDRIAPFILIRDPYSTWHSTKKLATDHVASFDVFVMAYRQLEKIYNRLQASGRNVPIIDLGAEHPERSLRQLFERLSIPYSERAVDGWQVLSSIHDPKSGIILGNDPPGYIADSVYERVTRSTGLRKLDTISPDELPADEMRAIAMSDILKIYDRLSSLSVRECYV